ncbi:MAG: NIPSNAP family protein [Devosia sp.]|nr:NIPSNAP family protein [Devosia sp.]
MLFDLRTYRCRPGTVARQLELYAASGYQAQCHHLGEPAFYGLVETGDVNSYVHLWRYRDAADREARRAALYADPEWRSYRDKGAELGYQIEQTNTLLRPASFWRDGGRR